MLQDPLAIGQDFVEPMRPRIYGDQVFQDPIEIGKVAIGGVR